MKKYDYNKIKKFIEKNKQNIKSVNLGMYEDWSWTSDCIYENGEFIIGLSENTKIAGINASTFATPAMEVEFQDGTSSIYNAYIDDEKENQRSDFSYFAESTVRQNTKKLKNIGE